MPDPIRMLGAALASWFAEELLGLQRGSGVALGWFHLGSQFLCCCCGLLSWAGKEGLLALLSLIPM